MVAYQANISEDGGTEHYHFLISVFHGVITEQFSMRFNENLVPSILVQRVINATGTYSFKLKVDKECVLDLRNMLRDEDLFGELAKRDLLVKENLNESLNSSMIDSVV